MTILFTGAVVLWALGADFLYAQARAPMPVILISVDTLRADRLSSYGYRGVSTAGIDAMARGGTIFSQASSQAPLTLPSHVSLLTSTFPFTNGVRDNGEQVGPNLVGLAGVLKSRGYRTAAFVGGFVLDRRFGMDKGFDTYDSPFDLNGAQGADSGDLKRPAEEVTAAAMRWVDANSSQPFFLFLHLFDLHTPYILPSAVRARFPNSGYDAALSYVDTALGRFWDFLEKKGLPRKALVIFLADHGESLGDHGERTHGFFVYQSTMRVPLIFHWPEGSSAFPARVDQPVSLLDVAPTILDFLGVQRPPQFQGRSFLEFGRQKGPFADREVYAESLYASNHLGCAPLLSMRVGRYKYIDAPKPELYDLTQDPGEVRNIYTPQNANATPLARKLSNVRNLAKSSQSGRKTPSPEVVARLRSLGYLASSASAPAGTGADPKDKIAAYEQSRRAIAMTLSGKYAESVPLFESVLSKNPEFLDARNILGLTLQKLGRHDEAIGNFRKVLEKDSLNLSAHYNMAVSYTDLDRLDDAAKELEATLAIAAPAGRSADQAAIPAQELLGRILLQKKAYEPARRQFEELLKIAPRNFTAHYNLGWLATLEGKWDIGSRHLQAAIDADPGNATPHNALGNLYLRKKELDRAHREFLEAVRLNPKDAWAHYNLGVVLRHNNEVAQAAAEFRKALECDPGFRDASDALARLPQEGK